ncbi:2-hydroxyglutaryl-CoA dehydratase [Patescibacteria group bacterium]|nr:2-hydroxyglutaryl-CoA dehydratase [Patescibacteria group bacterium]
MFLGIDVGSVTTKAVILNKRKEVVDKVYLLTQGSPIQAIKSCLSKLKNPLLGNKIKAAGATGSGRRLAQVVAGVDVVKNEITAQAVAALDTNSLVQTVIEIGGQDSKIIIIRQGVVINFAMNTLCAAGTGSFLDHQARRINISIEEFGKLALTSRNRVSISGRCTVFAESDMIQKAQLGYAKEDIIRGLCEALVRNYLNNLTKGKEILPPVVFQGGVAANQGMKKAFEDVLGIPILVPPHYVVSGAIGVALLAQEYYRGKPSCFKGPQVLDYDFTTRGFECQDCPNQCEIVEIFQNGQKISSWGSRCGKRNT